MIKIIPLVTILDMTLIISLTTRFFSSLSLNLFV